MATKIKDGLFIGDAEASQDPEFIELNKITFVINCAGHQLPNLWEQHGLHYLTFPWTSEPKCVLFDSGNVVIVQITNFIDEALEKGDSVLVHSFRGTGRCIACASAYLMFRHRWGFEKALDFLCSKRSYAAPNAGIVQQLYHLDVRLCAHWFGQDNEPAEDDRVRHDQWIPLVPGKSLRPKPGRHHQQQQRMQSLSAGRPMAFARNAQGKDDVAVVISDAVAGRFGGAASDFPSLGGLSEVQEEELVLVHSFLNSQPQIDALPPGRAQYEDHVPRELHWIDRPRMDKLTAAGRLSANETGQSMIPVSPRTGRVVPERPGNSSYNAMSRGKQSRISRFASPTGILKGGKAKRSMIDKSDGRESNFRSPALETEARVLGFMAGGDASAGADAAASAGDRGGKGPLESLRHQGSMKEEDEVIVEDLSEPRSDYWATGGKGLKVSTEEHENDSGGDLSSGCEALGSPLSRDGLDDSFTEEDEIAGAVNGGSRLDEDNCSKIGATAASETHPTREPTAGEPKKHNRPSSFERRGQEVRDAVVAPARQEERQAWEGSASARATVDSGEGSGNDRVRANDVRSETKTKHFEVSRNEKTRAQLRAPSAQGSANQPRDDDEVIVADIPPTPGASRTWDGRVGEGGGGAGGGIRQVGGEMNLSHEDRSIEKLEVGGEAPTAVEAAKAAVVNPSMRRGGSEGSLRVSGIDATSTKPTTNFMQESTRFPQAPRGRPEHVGEMGPGVSPDPSWGPGNNSRRDDLASGDPRQPGKGDGLGMVGHDTSAKGQGERATKAASARRQYPAGEGSGSLMQLAQTPNPQQRRLPSPRIQQGPEQVDRRQNRLPSGNMFPQERPTSAPSQRPEEPSNGVNSGSGGRDGRDSRDSRDENRIATTESADSFIFEAAKNHPPKSSSMRTTHEGYPMHGLMPSGSKLTMNDHLRQRWREATSARNGHSHAAQTHANHGPSRTGDGGGRGGGSGGEGGGGGGGAGVDSSKELRMGRGAEAGGLYSSTESLRLARMLAGGGAESETRATNAPRSGRERGGSGRGPLPREIRTSSQSAAPSTEAQRTRVVQSFTPPPSARKKHGGGSGSGSGSGSGVDFACPHRRGFGGGETRATESSLLHGLLRQNAGSTLPLPSRKVSSSSNGCSVDGGIGNGNGNGNGISSDAGRWANPAPRGRQRDASASGSYAATYSYPGSAEIRANGGGGGGGGGVSGDGTGGGPARASRASEGANYSSALSRRPQSSGGSGPRSNRAGGAQTYRSGSPAPGRGRRSSAAAAAAFTSAAAGTSDSSRYSRQQQASTHGAHKPRQHRSGIPPGFRGYIMPTGSSGADDVGFGASASPRGHGQSSTSRDRGRRMGRDAAGRQGQGVAAPKAGILGAVPRSFSIANRSFGGGGGHRPSTTEGLTGDSAGGGGRRGRSSSPAPRPYSASGRRRSASPSPANLLGTTLGQTASGGGLFVVPSFERPRWK